MKLCHYYILVTFGVYTYVENGQETVLLLYSCIYYTFNLEMVNKLRIIPYAIQYNV
jgi:hypothetical protein